MVPQNIRFMIKHKIQQGMSKSEVAREHSISRQTIYNVLAEEKTDRQPRVSILDPYKTYIRSRLEEYNLSARRLFREIQEQGYPGSYSTVKPFVRSLKQKVVSKITERFETLPGKQAQLDWGECGVIEHQGQRRKLYVFTYVLGYSRMLYARFCISMNQDELLKQIHNSFALLGCPQKMLVDNMKTAVNLHIHGQEVQWNPRFLDFMQHHDVYPVAAPPYWPRVKGKVENAVAYVKQVFLEGCQFRDLDDLNQQVQHWLDTVANVRIHGTTGEQPVVRYQRELPHLRSLSELPAYQIVLPETRKVAFDCHVSYQGVRYSVPPEYAGERVEISEDAGQIRLCFQGREIARHPVAEPGTLTVSSEAHMQAARAYKSSGKRKQGPKFQQTEPEIQETGLHAYEQLLQGEVA